MRGGGWSCRADSAAVVGSATIEFPSRHRHEYERKTSERTSDLLEVISGRDVDTNAIDCSLDYAGAVADLGGCFSEYDMAIGRHGRDCEELSASQRSGDTLNDDII